MNVMDVVAGPARSSSSDRGRARADADSVGADFGRHLADELDATPKQEHSARHEPVGRPRVRRPNDPNEHASPHAQAHIPHHAVASVPPTTPDTTTPTSAEAADAVSADASASTTITTARPAPVITGVAATDHAAHASLDPSLTDTAPPAVAASTAAASVVPTSFDGVGEAPAEEAVPTATDAVSTDAPSSGAPIDASAVPRPVAPPTASTDVPTLAESEAPTVSSSDAPTTGPAVSDAHPAPSDLAAAEETGAVVEHHATPPPASNSTAIPNTSTDDAPSMATTDDINAVDGAGGTTEPDTKQVPGAGNHTPLDPSAHRPSGHSQSSSSFVAGRAHVDPQPTHGADAIQRERLVGHVPGTARLELDLADEGLGPLRLQALTNNGTLHLQLSSSDAGLRDVIARHVSDLRADIAAAGIDLGSLDVGSAPEQHRGQTGGTNEQLSSGSSPRSADGGAIGARRPASTPPSRIRPNAHHSGGDLAVDLRL